MDLAIAAFGPISQNRPCFNINWFSPLVGAYSAETIKSFVSCTSRTYTELRDFVQKLPDKKRRLASEFYEFPVISRYPFLRTGNIVECWHAQIFVRGMESFVHSVLSESGQSYIESFSKMFERHVVGEAKKAPALFLSESDIRGFLVATTKVPDALLSYPECNIFVEAKAGLFDESVMTVGNSEIFSHKTKALRKAASQAWSASTGLRQQGRAPSQVLNAPRDYLLIVTNKELSTSRGTSLASMYPAYTLDYPDEQAKQHLPLEHAYVLSIEDFERLIGGVCASAYSLPSLLADCVNADLDSETSAYYFEMHLDRLGVKKKYSDLVHSAFEDAQQRLRAALEGRGRNTR